MITIFMNCTHWIHFVLQWNRRHTIGDILTEILEILFRNIFFLSFGCEWTKCFPRMVCVENALKLHRCKNWPRNCHKTDKRKSNRCSCVFVFFFFLFLHWHSNEFVCVFFFSLFFCRFFSFIRLDYPVRNA